MALKTSNKNRKKVDTKPNLVYNRHQVNDNLMGLEASMARSLKDMPLSAKIIAVWIICAILSGVFALIIF